MIDPRVEGARKMLSGISRIVAVMSPKGGVGKTLFSVSLSICASEMGLSTGLLDADVTNPTAHIPLGIDPESIGVGEEHGIVPPRAKGILFMSPVFFVEDRAFPLRGHEISSALRELLAITNWGKLDLLVVDTPPGLADETLELLSLLPKKEAIVITTPSPLSEVSTLRLRSFLEDEGIPVLAVVRNMSGEEGEYDIPFIPDIDSRLGEIEKTSFHMAVRKICTKLLKYV